MNKLEFSSEHNKMNLTKVKEIISGPTKYVIIGGISVFLAFSALSYDANNTNVKFNEYMSSNSEISELYNQTKDLKEAKSLLGKIYGKDYIENVNLTDNNFTYSNFKNSYNSLNSNYNAIKKDRLVYKLDETGMKYLESYINNEASIIASYIEQNETKNYNDVINTIMKEKILDESELNSNHVIDVQKIYTEKGKGFNIDLIIDDNLVTICADERINNIINNIQNGSLEDIKLLSTSDIVIDLKNSKFKINNELNGTAKLSALFMALALGCLIATSYMSPSLENKSKNKKTV